MRSIRQLTAASILVLCASVLTLAQEGDFSLGQGRVGEPYQQNIQKVLAERYGMRLESGSQTPAFEWAQPENLPPGLTLSADGTITGVPRAHQEQPYRVKVRVTDRSMRDAEALDVHLSIQILPPRIRLVKNNAPRLVPLSPESGQPAEANVHGNGSGGSAVSARVAAPPEAKPTPAEAAEAEGDARRAEARVEANVAPTPQQESKPDPDAQSVNVNQYLNIFEQTEGGNKFVLTASDDLIQSGIKSGTEQLTNDQLKKLSETDIVKEQLRRINFRLRADRESTIAVQRHGRPTGSGAIQGLKFRVSAQLVADDGTTPVPVVGDPVDITPQSPASFTPAPSQAELNREGAVATINLKQASADAGDTLRVIVDAYTDKTLLLGTHSFDIELTDLGWESGVSPSMFLLNRQRVRNDDIQPVIPTTPGETQLTNTINPVNYSPFPGISYTFTYKGNERRKSDFMKTLEPGFGVNLTFMDFDDETISVQQAFQTLENRFLREQSDVQLGIGAVVSFFGNKLQVTYGSNLSVDRKRAYFGIGADFVRLLGLLR